MDALCERIFLTRDARQTDDNLSFVRNRLLHTGEDDGNGKNDLAALLDRYRRIRAGQRIRDDETDPVCVTLQLSGVVKTDERGYLGVRNRIYDRVFDPEWVTTHLPGAETRRQQAAFQRGVLRTAAIAAAALLIVGTLASIAVYQAAAARRMERIARERLDVMNAREGVRLLEENDPLAAIIPLTDAARSEAIEANEKGDSLSALRLAFAYRQAPRLIYSVACGSPILSAEIDGSGTRFVTATKSGMARVWDAATGRPVTPKMRHNKAIRHAAFSPDGTKVATASEDGTARIWDSRTGEPLTPPLRYHFEGIAQRVDWSPDGRRLAVSGSHGAVLYDASTGEGRLPIWDDDLPKWGVHDLGRMETHAVAFAPDSKRLAFAANTYLANFADPVTGKMNGVLGNCYSGNFITYSPDGKRVAIAGDFSPKQRGGGGNGACIFDAATGAPLALIKNEDQALDARFSPDGRLLATASRDGTARIADAQTGRLATPSLVHAGVVTAVRFSADGKRLVTACQDGTAHIWDAHTGASLSPLLRQAGPLCAALFVRDDRHVFTAGADGAACLWEIPSPDAVSHPLDEDLARETAVTLRLVATKGSEIVVKTSLNYRWYEQIFDAGSGKPLTEKRPDPSSQLSAKCPYGDVCSNFWPSPDNRYLLFAPYGFATRPLPPGTSIEKGAFLWDIRRNVIHFLPFRWQEMSFHQYSATGRFLLTYNRAPRLWDTQTGREFSPPLKIPAQIISAAFTRDDRFVAVGGDDGAAQIWDIEAGKPLLPPILLRRAVLSVAFRPDGRCLATVARDGAAQVWDAKTGEKVTPTLRQPGGVREACFTADGQYLVTSGKTEIRIWNLSSALPPLPKIL